VWDMTFSVEFNIASHVKSRAASSIGRSKRRSR
jgi:hypothetical protein